VYLIDRLLVEEGDSGETAILERLSLSKALQNLDERSRKIIFLRYLRKKPADGGRKNGDIPGAGFEA